MKKNLLIGIGSFLIGWLWAYFYLGCRVGLSHDYWERFKKQVDESVYGKE